METPMVLVCGATGYLGGHVCLALKQAGYRVRALARSKARLSDEILDACDDVFEGQATDLETLAGCADECDVVFSSIGIRSAARSPTFWQVDRDANLNIVRRAQESNVKLFIFTSAFKADELAADGEDNSVASARETVVEYLKTTEMRSVILRPTGFFNDASEFFKMAVNGRGWNVGNGLSKINFIHGADIAEEVVKLLKKDYNDDEEKCIAFPMGGPDIYTWNEVFELAFEALDKPVRISYVPAWILSASACLVYPFNQNVAGLLKSFAQLAVSDVVAPQVGTHHLKDFFEELAAAEKEKQASSEPESAEI